MSEPVRAPPGAAAQRAAGQDAPPSLRLLLDEQSVCWESGQRILAEVLLQRHVRLHDDPQAVLQLIFHEILLREKAGEQVHLQEYLDRFPDRADQVRDRFAVHAALMRGILEPPFVPAVVPQRQHEVVMMPASPHPPSPSPLSPELWQQINSLITRFEADWHNAANPRIEAFLEQAPADAQPELFRQLLRIEVDQRLSQGKPLTVREAAQRFAALGPWAGPILASLGLDSSSAPLILDVIAGPQSGRSFQLTGHGNFIIGRGSEQDGVHLSFRDDKGMSRLHFLLESNPPLARVVDLRSTNKTFLNGEEVKEANLRDGDEIHAGQTRFKLHLPHGDLTMELDAAQQAQAPSVSTVETISFRPSVPGYELKEELGRGGMGVVYRAIRLDDRREVAVKTILPAVAPRPETLVRFQREIALLQRLSHPNIVQWLDAGEANGMLYFAMEYVPGRNASTLVKEEGPLAAERVVRLGCQVLDGLAHAHLQGIVHRDVKPGNVLVMVQDGREVLKLADFGLGRAYRESAMSGLTLSGTAGGTPGYVPPEQVSNFHAARPSADQYSAAATLYYLLTGQPIYETTGHACDVLLRIVDQEPLPLRRPPEGPPLPRKLGEVICRALARDPRQRFPDVLLMREALVRAVC